MAELRPEIATILFTDIVSSTALMQRVGDDVEVVMSAAILHDEDGAPAGTIGIARSV